MLDGSEKRHGRNIKLDEVKKKIATEYLLKCIYSVQVQVIHTHIRYIQYIPSLQTTIDVVTLLQKEKKTDEKYD